MSCVRVLSTALPDPDYGDFIICQFDGTDAYADTSTVQTPSGHHGS